MNGYGLSVPKTRKIIGLGKKPSPLHHYKNCRLEQKDEDSLWDRSPPFSQVVWHLNKSLFFGISTCLMSLAFCGDRQLNLHIFVWQQFGWTQMGSCAFPVVSPRGLGFWSQLPVAGWPWEWVMGISQSQGIFLNSCSRCQPPETSGWWKKTGPGRRWTLRLGESNQHAPWVSFIHSIWALQRWVQSGPFGPSPCCGLVRTTCSTSWQEIWH